jgi:hypothetical protein
MRRDQLWIVLYRLSRNRDAAVRESISVRSKCGLNL